MTDWFDNPSVKVFVESASMTASLARATADEIVRHARALAEDPAEAEAREYLETIAVTTRERPSTFEGADIIGEFFTMIDMTAAAHGLKSVDAGPGPVAEAGWSMIAQAPVYRAARHAAVAVLDGGALDLAAYEESIVDNPPPPMPGTRHLQAVTDE